MIAAIDFNLNLLALGEGGRGVVGKGGKGGGWRKRESERRREREGAEEGGLTSERSAERCRGWGWRFAWRQG